MKNARTFEGPIASPGAAQADSPRAADAAMPHATRTERQGDSLVPTQSVAKSGARKWLHRIVWGAAWLGASLLLVVALLRIGYRDETLLLTCINAFTLYVYLPAYLILAWAIWQRRWVLAGVSAMLVSCHLAWVSPDFAAAQNHAIGVPSAAQSRTIKIFYGNVAAGNEDRLAYLDEIAQADADIVVLVEYRRYWHADVMASPIGKRYRYGTGLSEPYLGEIAIFSKLPIKPIQRYWPTGRQVSDVEVEVDGKTLRLLCIHGPRPMNTPGNKYVEYWSEMLPVVATRSGPTIAVGDFNATQHAKIYEAITSSGLRSAHVDRGRGWAVSWPNGMAMLPPIRIDHAFLSPKVECLEIVEGEGRGSDHKPLIFEVRLCESTKNSQKTSQASGANRRAIRRAGAS